MEGVYPVPLSGMIQLSADMKHNEKNFVEKQWCTDRLCHVTQALHISSQCPRPPCLIKITGMQQTLCSYKAPISPNLSARGDHNSESCDIGLTERCVHGWNILQIPQSSDNQDFIRERFVCSFTPRGA